MRKLIRKDCLVKKVAHFGGFSFCSMATHPRFIDLVTHRAHIDLTPISDQ